MDTISFRLILWLVAMSSIALAEGILGIATGHLWVVIDFLNTSLLILTLCISVKAIEFWSAKCKEQSKNSADLEGGAGKSTIDLQFNFGYQRVCLLASLLNFTFMIFTSMFDIID